MNDALDPLTLEALNLPVGHLFELDMVGVDYKHHRCSAKLVGYQTDTALLLTLLDKAPQVKLNAGLKFDCRCATVVGWVRFSARLLAAPQQPFAHVLLTWPDEIQYHGLRKEPRFRVDLPAKVVAHTELGKTLAPLEGRLQDISIHGGLLRCSRELTRLVKRVELDVALRFANFRRQRPLWAEITRSVSLPDADDDPPFAYGLCFVDVGDLDRLFLYAMCQDLLQQGLALDCIPED